MLTRNEIGVPGGRGEVPVHVHVHDRDQDQERGWIQGELVAKGNCHVQMVAYCEHLEVAAVQVHVQGHMEVLPRLDHPCEYPYYPLPSSQFEVRCCQRQICLPTGHYHFRL